MSMISLRSMGGKAFSLSFLLLLASPLAGAAQTMAAGASAGISRGDNAWVLASSALVLMMTAPGLILFYGGLVRTKNVLSTMMHSLILMAVVSTLWMLFGYSMAFARGNPFFGNPTTYLFLNRVGANPNTAYSSTIPQETFMLFQMMFAIITPALISGAIAERVKFKAYLLFTILWMTVVYFPLCHMMWGDGGFFNWAGGGRVPVLDFAGGTVVHISSGVSALVFALVLGRRDGYPREPMMPHNVVLSLIGAGLLWVGWFGFNAGSALAAGPLATSAFAATHFSAAAAALSWTTTEWLLKGKPSVLGAASGMVAGLATITPASGFVTVPAAFCIGLAGGIVCYFAVTSLKAVFRYDDSLDVFGVHGIGSTIGMLMVGFLADVRVNPAIGSAFTRNGAVISLAGGPNQFLNQLLAVLFTIALAAAGTFVILKVVGAATVLRVSQEDESIGLDLSQHGERAYNE
ncbi:MAG: ammonium transporter [Verrucomicrobia bacterium]|nr:ammonium transporter [Verrucomicrobiota bacterium]MDE3097852.1 ammonium transporter [Verrucomicrobiota bacterium]